MKNRVNTPSTESPEKMIANLRTMVAEAEKVLADSGGEHSESTMENLRARLESAQESLQEFYANARQKVVDGSKYADETIRTHPYESLAVALGVGVLIGALLRRGKS